MKKSAAACFLEGLRVARLQAALEATADLIKNPAPVPMRSVARGLFLAKVNAKAIKGAAKVSKAVDALGKSLWDRSGATRKKRARLLKSALQTTSKLRVKLSKRCGL